MIDPFDPDEDPALIQNITQYLGRTTVIVACIVALFLCGHVGAQNGRPVPNRPEPQTPVPAPPAAPDRPVANDAPPVNHTGNGRSTAPVRKTDVPAGLVSLAFNDAPVDEKIIAFIAESTGKVVIPINLSQLRIKKITLINEQPIERSHALDLVLTALRLNGVGISETDDIIVLDDIANQAKKQYQVVTADEDIMDRMDRGNFVVKVYRLREAAADTVYERLDEVRPDYATLSVDTNSNQVILYGDVGTAQHFQRIINELDRTHVKISHKTFHLAHADATSIADQIYELFENTQVTTAGGGQQQPRQPQQGRAPRGAPRTGTPGAVSGTPAGLPTPGPVVELRVSVNVQQNSVTVSAEPQKIESIEMLIREQWDLPRERETFRVYILEHTDPIKMRDLITNLMGAGSAGRSSSARAGQAAGGARTAQPAGGAGGGGGGVSEAIGDIYRVEAYPDGNKIVVMSKTKEALDYLDMFIRANDQPSYAGLPHVVELKHANAVSLADELNVLLAEPGTGGSLERPASGLTAEGPGGFSGGTGTDSGGTAGTAGRTGGTTGGGGAAAGTIEFPWQRGRARDDQSEPSPLIGKVRLVPIVRQNAIAVLAPISQRQAIVEMIEQFDRPGRQVMISAIIAEVELTNDLALGLRFSSSAISPTFTDNAIGGTVGLEGTANDVLGSLFDTSVLDVGADINVILQALAQRTKVRIIQQPRIFTADNQEAAFFDGQQIPFITDSVVNSTVNGGVTQSFDYKDVGVLLNVRPRITVQRDVDMEIKLALSAVVPGITLFGGAILDLRQTTTKVIVKNAQTIVLSGLLKDVDSKITRSVPLLGDLPFIGELFKSRENTKSTTELIAFITPIVVDNPTENDDNFNQLERDNWLRNAVPLDQVDEKKERQRMRDELIAPKSASGVPMIELLPKQEVKGHYPPYDQPPPMHPSRPRPKADEQPKAKDTPADESEDTEADPPVDIDEVGEEPSS